MRNIIYFVVSLIVAIAAAFLLHGWLSQYDDPGYVLIGFANHSIETSLVVFAVASILIFFIFYFVFRLLGWLLRLPGKLKNKSRKIKFDRSQDALISGLVDSAEGNWEKAENVLIKHASNSGAPLIHYLTAAKAAQSRGAFEKRDEYLQLAKQNSPGSEIAVGLTQAELHLSQKQFDQALDTLLKIQSINPDHASTLKLLHHTYKHLGDWTALRKLIPSLHKHQVLMETEVKLLEAETFSMLLREAAQKGDASEAKKLWLEMPEHIQLMPGISATYFATMIEVGAGADIEEALAGELTAEWNDTLLVLYGSIQSADPVKQLRRAEKWLSSHMGDVVLLRILGKLCVQCDEAEKAEHYFTQSINAGATVAAYQMLGDLLYATGNKDRSSECYKRGLELASSQVVSHVEQISGSE